jgi:tripartite-type tricarboxylate transporter receptor subunit TctC
MLARRPLLGAGLALPFIRPAAAQGEWPNRTVRIIVPYPPAGSVDVLTRILGERLQQQLGQNFVIENRGGAGGNIGMDVLAKADPDGYTIGSATIGHFSINRYLYSRMPFDSDKDFAPISLTWELPNVFVVSSQHVPARTLQEFIAWAKQKQGGLSFGSPGVGTTPHLSGALFNSRVGLNADHVPFRGAAQTIPAMLSGDVTFALDNLSSYVPVVQEGRMRALAVTSPERVPSLPDVPTMAEAGVPDFVVTSWSAFVFPARTPRPIVDRLNAALKTIVADPSLQSRFGQVGAKPLWSTPEAVTERGQKERAMWQEAVRISGARAD